jgi:hypothetical protein
MITFRQKNFSEYDAMRSLYVELMKYSDKRMFSIIDSAQLLPILKGNNVVIERFVISTSFGHHDKYRMYIKIGAKAKLPDEVRLPSHVYDKRLINIGIKFGRKIFSKKGGKPGNGDGGDGLSVGANLPIDISIPVKELLGEALKYDKPGRSLVLEFNTIQDAIHAINILPFGINYKIYLLEV